MRNGGGESGEVLGKRPRQTDGDARGRDDEGQDEGGFEEDGGGGGFVGSPPTKVSRFDQEQTSHRHHGDLQHPRHVAMETDQEKQHGIDTVVVMLEGIDSEQNAFPPHPDEGVQPFEHDHNHNHNHSHSHDHPFHERDQLPSASDQSFLSSQSQRTEERLGVLSQFGIKHNLNQSQGQSQGHDPFSFPFPVSASLPIAISMPMHPMSLVMPSLVPSKMSTHNLPSLPPIATASSSSSSSSCPESHHQGIAPENALDRGSNSALLVSHLRLSSNPNDAASVGTPTASQRPADSARSAADMMEMTIMMEQQQQQQQHNKAMEERAIFERVASFMSSQSKDRMVPGAVKSLQQLGAGSSHSHPDTRQRKRRRKRGSSSADPSRVSQEGNEDDEDDEDDQDEDDQDDDDQDDDDQEDKQEQTPALESRDEDDQRRGAETRRFTFEVQWEMRFKELLEYKAKNGHTNVPREWKENKTLGVWVRTQRRQKMCGRLAPERVEKLDSIDFAWNAPIPPPWEEMHNELKIFKATFGHCCVPRFYAPNQRLAAWVQTQRRFKKTRRLRADREAALNEMGFIWESKRYVGYVPPPPPLPPPPPSLSAMSPLIMPTSPVLTQRHSLPLPPSTPAADTLQFTPAAEHELRQAPESAMAMAMTVAVGMGMGMTMGMGMSGVERVDPRTIPSFGTDVLLMARHHQHHHQHHHEDQDVVHLRYHDHDHDHDHDSSERDIKAVLDEIDEACKDSGPFPSSHPSPFLVPSVAQQQGDPQG